ncbi:vam6/vps39/trap1 like protein [Babesia gibsoni]|uniref:Vam6/vps39/trap1 like protein n=1 Tax=Babesia gibsoni TaxID=33632 RepID=A0AAD8LGA4_BABGI|nr:vam6/vps39/trap1 like protein [Babesia gibsoni]
MEMIDRGVLLRWTQSSKITAVSWFKNSLIIGNDAGEVYSFHATSFEDAVDANVYQFTKVSSKTIARICSLEPSEWLLVLNADGDLYTVDTFFSSQPSILRKRITCMAKQYVEVPGSVNYDDDLFMPLSCGNSFCVGTENKLYIYACKGPKIEQLRCITVDGVPLVASWLNETIAVGTKEVYYAMSPDGSTCHELCSNPQLDEGDDGESGIMTASCIDNDIMVVCQNIGIFYNTETMGLSKKNTIHWSNSLVALGYVPPFIIGITSEKVVEIYGFRDQLLYQTIYHTNTRFAYYVPERMTMMAATPNVVASLKPKGYYQSFSSALEQRNLKRAMHMVELYFPAEHPATEKELKIAHTIVGWTRFNDLSFPMAFYHFTKGDVDIVHLLSFWMHFADLNIPESYPRNSNIPLNLRQYIPCSMGINEFIEKKIGELGASLQRGTTACRLMEMASASFATFLLQHFDAKNFLQQNTVVENDFGRKLLGALEKTTLLLLAECDDQNCSTIINRAQDESFLDVEECEHQLMQMGKGEVYAKILVKKQRYKEALEIMAKCINEKLAAENSEENSIKIRAICCELASCLHMLIQDAKRDYADPKESSSSVEQMNSILSVHLPLLLESCPNAALGVLTRNHATLPFNTDEIIAMIDMYSDKIYGISSKDLRVKYLEDLVITNKYGNVYENTLLAKYYIDELIAHKKSRGTKDQNASVVKKTLVALLETNNNFDMLELEKLIAKLDLLEATVLVYNKYSRHGDALKTLFGRWPEKDRMKICEAYCLCFGELHPAHEAAAKDGAFKRLFTNIDHWMEKSNEWPLKNHEVYKIGKTEGCIDKLLYELLKIIVEQSKKEEACVYLARDLLSKYMPFCTYNSELKGNNIIELIPDDWNFALFANVFTQMHLKALHEERTIAMKRGLTRSVHSRTSKQLYQLTCVPPRTVDASSICSICQEPIKLGMSIALPPPRQKDGSPPQGPQQSTIMHEQCAKNIHDK